METPYEHILTKIGEAVIKTDPFPYIIIPEIFSAEFYAQLLAAIPAPDQFVPAEYPGTGFGKAKRAKRQSSGLAYPNLSELPLFRELQAFLRSDEFCRALLDKFTCPNGIPPDKRRFFSNGARDFSSVFDLQIDRRGYEILPHPDVPSKIVTFQCFLVRDASLKDFGTMFCRTKNGLPPSRGVAAQATGAFFERVAALCHGRPMAFWHWFERTKLGTEIGFGDSKGWYPWRMFDVRAIAPALPNHFMAFAPNDRSYHAVRMDIPESSIGRTVIRGFIRAGNDTTNYISIDHCALTEA